MSLFAVILLSFVEGITEFLPISSTGHLILASNLLMIPQTEFVKSFEIFIQLGAILAIVFLYFQTLTKKPGVVAPILIAFLPTGILGFTLYTVIKKFLLGDSFIVILSLFIGGVFLLFFERFFQKKENIQDIEHIPWQKAFSIGLFQSLSMIPGVSRSAATIIGGMWVGVERKTAVEFSFLLAIPTMLAATTLDLVKSSFSFTFSEYIFLLVGFVGAFITAFFTVRLFTRFVQNHTLIPFGIYRILLALAFLFFPQVSG